MKPWKMVIAPIGAVLLVVQLSTIHVSCDGPRGNIPKTFDYSTYVRTYDKSYDATETLSRANLFYARTMGIFKTNLLYIMHKAHHYLKQNEYTDMTAEETKKLLVGKNIDLVPVVEANLSPEAPADQFIGLPDDDDDDAASAIKDGFSQSSLDEEPPRKPTVNFFSNRQDSGVQPRLLVRELAQHSDVAKKLSRVIETKDVAHETDKADSYRRANNIPFKPLIKVENERYDPSLVPSFAWFEDVDRATNTFATFMMEDFVGNLEPYPMPDIPTKRVLKDEDLPPRGASVLSEFMDSIRTVYDYFSKDDDAVIVTTNKDELDEEQKENSRNDTVANEPNKSADGKIVFDIDWRRTGCIPRPKSQSKCNACYAFATLDLMEFFYCRQKKTSTEFSVQYVIDCGSKSSLNGCQGGKLSNVGLFIQKYGLQLNAAYPYSALQHECPYDKRSDEQQKSWALKPTITGWRMFPEIQAWYKWLPKSPIIVGVNMPSDFLAYGGGVHDGVDCALGMVHAMLLVGSGKQDGQPFWLLKNTFAETWGEMGYFRLSKKAPIKCFNSAVVARAKFNE